MHACACVRVYVYARVYWTMESSSFLLILCLLVLVLLAIWKMVPAILEYRRKCRMVKSIPGWPTHWLLGNIPQFFPTEKQYFKWIDYIAAGRHKVTVMWVGPTIISISLHHPDAVRQVLKVPKSNYVYPPLLPWLGEGLLISKGENGLGTGDFSRQHFILQF